MRCTSADFRFIFFRKVSRNKSHVVRFAAELIAFPAGGIAAVVIGTVVMVMVVAKLVCVVTGYERRLPNLEFDQDEDDDQHKQIAYERQSIDGASSVVERTSNMAHGDSDDVISTTSGSHLLLSMLLSLVCSLREVIKFY